MERFMVASYMKCGRKILRSFHVHDYVQYTDSKGNYFMLDGGLDYQRFSKPKDIGVLCSVWNDDPIQLIREHMHWGKNYSKDKKLLKKTRWVKLKNITDDHLDALINYCEIRTIKYLEVFIKEKNYRNGNKNGITDSNNPLGS